MANTYPNGGTQYPNPGGGNSGATSLIVTSDNNTISQNGSSSYDPDTKQLSIDLSADSISGGLANQILYQNAPDVTDFITTANNAILVTDGSGVPSISNIIPDDTQANITTVGIIDSGTWNATPIESTYGGTGLSSIGTANQFLGINTGASALEYKTITGTINQITTTPAANLLTLSLPQDINTSSTPNFTQITVAADPTTSLQLATKQYVDATVVPLQFATAALVATSNITLSGAQTVDGVLTTTQVVLAENQTNPIENGLYTANTGGAWTRTTGYTVWSSFYRLVVTISGGLTQTGTSWQSTVGPTGTVGTNPIPFISAAFQTYTAGTGITLSAGAFSLTSPVLASLGGTGQTSYTTGDLLYASSPSALSKLSDVAIGSVLVSGGIGTAPSYSTTPQIARLGIGQAADATTPLAITTTASIGTLIQGTQTAQDGSNQTTGLKISPTFSIINTNSPNGGSSGLHCSPTFSLPGSSQTLLQAFGVRISNTFAASTSGTYTDFFSLYVSQPTVDPSTTITNYYALFVAGAAVATNFYGAFFQCPVGIGFPNISTSGYLLSIDGKARVTDNQGYYIGTTNTNGIVSSNLTGNRTFTLPDANSNSIQPLGSATANNWVQYISGDGVQHLAQPAFTNISGNVNLATQVTGILSNANTTATSANTASAIMARDGSGNVAANLFSGGLASNSGGTATAGINASNALYLTGADTQIGMSGNGDKVFFMQGYSTGNSTFATYSVRNDANNGVYINTQNSLKMNFGVNTGSSSGSITSFMALTTTTLGINTVSPQSNSVLHVHTSGVGGDLGLYVDNYAVSAGWGATFRQSSDASTPQVIQFLNASGAQCGTISTAGGTSTAYGTSSDHRLKENIIDIDNALEDVLNLKVKIYNYKSDPEKIQQIGLIAHEVQDTRLTFAVQGEKDAVDSDGKELLQMIDYSKLTPILAAAIQELNNKIEKMQVYIEKLEEIIKNK